LAFRLFADMAQSGSVHLYSEDLLNPPRHPIRVVVQEHVEFQRHQVQRALGLGIHPAHIRSFGRNKENNTFPVLCPHERQIGSSQVPSHQ
jgi:ABC-type thiamine transport system ATPase subunit